MALPPSTANWHWKNKNVTRWGKEWFERELTSLSVSGDNATEQIKITQVFDVDGDIELGQRKSKLITIYDCRVILDWEGTTSDGKSVKGKLTIPEVSHEITLDGLSNYQYSWTVNDGSSSPEIQSLIALGKSKFPALLEEKFTKFPVDLVETHGKDLTVSADPSRAGTPRPSTTPSNNGATTSAPAAQPAKKPEAPKTAVNTSTITSEASFMASAADLFSMLTDEKRIPTWTRAAAQSAAKPDTEYSLFGGGVKGKYISLNPPKEIVQTWALANPTWPSGHFATLTTTLVQGSDSTTLTLTLSGVPTGMEEDVKRNLEGYYIHGFKSIGLGSVL